MQDSESLSDKQRIKIDILKLEILLYVILRRIRHNLMNEI